MGPCNLKLCRLGLWTTMALIGAPPVNAPQIDAPLVGSLLGFRARAVDPQISGLSLIVFFFLENIALLQYCLSIFFHLSPFLFGFFFIIFLLCLSFFLMFPHFFDFFFLLAISPLGRLEDLLQHRSQTEHCFNWYLQYLLTK